MLASAGIMGLALCAGERIDVGPPVEATLNPALVKRSNGDLCVGVTLKMEKAWHIFWSNPGDSGAPPTITMTLPDGYKARGIVFPRPMVLGDSHERIYGYEGSVELLVPIDPPAGGVNSPIEVRADVNWMACKEACVIGQSTIQGLIATDAGVRVDAKKSPAQVTSLPADWVVQLTGAGENWTLEVSPPKGTQSLPQMQFVPDPMAGIEFKEGAGPFSAVDGKWTIPLAYHEGDTVDGPPMVRGLILAGKQESDSAYLVAKGPIQGQRKK